ncbi:DUF1971 domain-containing protein [uncultured Tateyamaria sp.]|uniref:DUF1971 domain-containing protein n=1 Tax=uncultured Tateyamaria sp. TaxID=455651 RepID=UPI00260798AF|nr:DUF1971 domain-containing protein [uncultured Tateyamaria sp.]
MTVSLPHDAIKYAQTKTFDETTIPQPLLSNHSTKPNSWGLIVIESGQLLYTRIDREPQLLAPENPGVILPRELHKIAPDGSVRFHIEFYHDPATKDADRDNEEVAL